MSSIKKLLIIGSIIVGLILLVISDSLIPKIDIQMNGQKIVDLEVGQSYQELGAVAHLSSAVINEKLNVKISDNIDNSKVGKYTVTYETQKEGITKKVIRIINVKDTTKPEITVEEPVKLCSKKELVEINAQATDNYDGDLTDKIKYKIVKDKVYISVEDSSNNKTEITKELKYIDSEKPIIKLNGEAKIYLKLGEKYQEIGASAFDSCDGDLTNNIKINNKVDGNTPGNYEVIYSVKDSENNEAILKREVIVIENKESLETNIEEVSDGVVYLTFDDGPGQYTRKVLEILDEYHAKATFFVTNQFPQYQYLIKEENLKGHSVGIHTFSHKWSIYNSVDSYLEDFYKIENIVFEQTGKHPDIFRFPGGSSNTVSKNYCLGIMSELAKVMTDKGYVYFDWTFDSGDTHLKNNSKEDILKNIKTYLKGNGEYIILMHDIKKNTLEALPEILEYIQKRGYKTEVLTSKSTPKHFKIAN